MKDTLTLQQGLEKFRAANSKYFSARSISEEGKAFLKDHDIAHVIFNCDTSLYGEGVVKTWTTFGTTLGFWEVINGYQEVNAFELFRMYSFKHISKNIFRYLKVIPTIIRSAKNMSKPWPFSNYEPYLNTPIAAIRKEFNIQVLKEGGGLPFLYLQ